MPESATYIAGDVSRMATSWERGSAGIRLFRGGPDSQL
jgi:hypothetical protein